jgi:hypothetical protein
MNEHNKRPGQWIDLEGAISGEVPVSIAFPPGLAKEHVVMILLDRFGILNVHITVLIRPTVIQSVWEDFQNENDNKIYRRLSGRLRCIRS